MKDRKRHKVLIAQERTPSLESAYGELKEDFDVDVDFCSFTRAKFISDHKFRIYKPMILEKTVFLFTSKTIIKGFFGLAQKCNIALPKTTKYFLATKTLENYLGKYIEIYKRRIFSGERGLEDLFPIMYKYKKEKFFLPCSDVGRKSISDFFHKKKYHYTELPIYHNTHCDLKNLNPSKYDVIVFFSPFSVEAFEKNFPNFTFNNLKIAAFGTKTIEEAIKKNGWPPITIAAPTAETPSMIGGLINYFGELMDKEKKSSEKRVALS